MNFDNQSILVTGASTGIGKAIAVELSNYNCKLFLLARRIELLEELKRELDNNSAQIYVLKCDVSKKDEVEDSALKVKEETDFIDIAILNAGAGERIDPENYNSVDAEEIFGANVFGIIYWIEQLLPDYLKQRKGVIVGVSSLADVRGYSGSGFYCSSKAAASKYLEGLAVELAGYGIDVLTVRPGFVKTPMTDKNEFKMPLLMQPDKAAKIILNGISKRKRYIQFPWQTVLATWVVEMIPNWLYEYLARKDFDKKRRNQK